MVSLNAKITPDLRRRLLIARANTGKSVSLLVTEWIEAGLVKLESADKQQKPGKR